MRTWLSLLESPSLDGFTLEFVKRGMHMRFGKQKSSSKYYSLKVIAVDVVTVGNRGIRDLKFVLLFSDQCPETLHNF